MYQTETIKLASLALDPRNARKHDKKNIAAIKGSLKAFGQQKPIVVDGDGIIIAGNGTYVAAKELGWDEIAIYRTELKGDEAKAYALADNRSGELAEWDDAILDETLKELISSGIDVAELGFDIEDFAKDFPGDVDKPSMVDKFGAPPFTILDTRQGYWQERKRQWLAIGIQSELGRGGQLLFNGADAWQNGNA